MPHKLFIKTYGCQMNVYDSVRMTDLLAPHGYELCEDQADADLVILNTCHIREKAVEKVYSELGRIRDSAAERAHEGKATLVGVAGCVAQAEGAEIARRAPVVNFVVGPQSYHRLPELIAQARRARGAVIETDFPVEEKFDHLIAPSRAQLKARGPAAFLTVQEGCDKFCTFCVVPYTRGTEFSRSIRSIVDEAQLLVEGGVKDITLLGQNVNAYRGQSADGTAATLAALLRALAQIDGLKGLRYTTSHPRDMDDDLIAMHGELDVLMPYLHLPVQSGSDKILHQMNRGHTAADYLKIIEKIRRVRPGIALSSDFIVGFPGETEQDFEATLQLVEEVGYAQAFSFKYSPRPGTPASAMAVQVAEEVKDERLTRLQTLLTHQSRDFNKACVGQHMRVLFDRLGRVKGQLAGRTPYLQPIHAEAPEDMLGSYALLKITEANSNSLSGVLCKDAAAPEESTARRQFPLSRSLGELNISAGA